MISSGRSLKSHRHQTRGSNNLGTGIFLHKLDVGIHHISDKILQNTNGTNQSFASWTVLDDCNGT
jgi:hypothetical protein